MAKARRSAEASSRLWRILAPIIGWCAAIALLCEIAIFCLYFAVASIFMLVSPGLLEPANMAVAAIHVLAAATSCVAFVVVVQCVEGSFRHKSLARRFVLALSGLGLLPLPVALGSGGLEHIAAVQLLACLAGMSLVLLATTLIAFSYMESEPRGKRDETGSQRD